MEKSFQRKKKARSKVYSLLLLKAYFDRGLGLTSYVKYLIGFLGIFQLIDAKLGVQIVLLYMIFCVLLGWIWKKYKFWHIENEIQNRLNPFQIEVRRALRKRNI